MANFPIYRTETTISPRAPVRGSIDPRIGAAEIGQAISQAGSAIASLGMKYELKEANTQFSQYKRQVKEDDLTLSQEILQETDPAKHDEIHRRHAQNRAKLLEGLSNRRAAEAARLWDNNQAPIRQEALLKGKKARIEDNWRAELFAKQQEVARTGEMGDIAAFIARGIKIDQDNPDEIGMPLDKLEAAKILASTKQAAAVAQVKQQYMAGNYDVARQMVDDSEILSIEDKETLLVNIGVAQRRAQTVQTQASIEAQKELYAREDAGEPLTRKDYERAYPDPDEADQRYDEYRANQAAIARGEADQAANGVPQVLAMFEATIDLRPETITEEDIWRAADKGVGYKNAARLVDRLQANKAKKFAPEQKYDSQLSTLLNAGYFGDKDEAETSNTYLDLKRKMTEFITSQKPSEKDADTYFKRLIVDDFKLFSWGGWDEKGKKFSYEDAEGNQIEQTFRYGDIRNRRTKDGKVIQEFFAGPDENGNPLWIPRLYPTDLR